MKAQKFEDLDCWVLSRELCKQINFYVKAKDFSKDFQLVGQIRDSSGSVMDNIAEGFERGSNKEFIQFLFISKSSNAELRSQLYRALDNNYINDDQFHISYNHSIRIKKMLTSLINHLKNNLGGGLKHR